MPSPIDILLNQHTPPDVLAGVAQRMRQRRKEQRLSQQELSLKSGVSLGSLKRFEREHQISLESLVKLALPWAARMTSTGYSPSGGMPRSRR